jgi:hypothetical protein
MKLNKITVAVVALLLCGPLAYSQTTTTGVGKHVKKANDSVRVNPLACQDNTALWRGYVKEQENNMVPASNVVLPPVVDSTFRIRRTDLSPAIKLIRIN